MSFFRTVCLLTLTFFVDFGFCGKYDDVNEARKYLHGLNRTKVEMAYLLQTAQWNYATNITEWNRKALESISDYTLKRDEELWKDTIKYQFDSFKDPLVKRQFENYVKVGLSALGSKAPKLRNMITEMETIYSTATVDIGQKKNLSLEPDLTKIMANERDYNLLKEVWTKWRNATGRKMRSIYPGYVELSNEMAKKNSFGSMRFNDYGEYWLDAYKDPNIRAQIERLWHEVEPFYNEVHSYVHEKLQLKYGNLMPSDGTIPAHLLGNMWAQQWGNIMDLVTPFPNAPSLDVTQTMKEQKYTVRRMYDLAESFFVGIGLEKMTPEFWNKSMIEKPTDRQVVCHASAWNFQTKTDFRVKTCTDITMVDLATVHHEMGHIEYYMMYRDQPYPFRAGANPGFHEAVGDVISLSVTTPRHLQQIGLLAEGTMSHEMVINHQMKMALQKLVFMPYAYIIDLWRWKIFSGEVTSKNYNAAWWELRKKYQKITPPVERTEEDFDPGAKYHVAANYPYISYFVSHIVQFQIHEVLCKIANMSVLHECDIHNNKEVGKRLRSVLQQGSSAPAQQQLVELTGMEMNAKSFLRYFQPLRTFLQGHLGQASDRKYQADEHVQRSNSRGTVISQVLFWGLCVVLLCMHAL